MSEVALSRPNRDPDPALARARAYELNWVDLAEGDFSTQLLTARVNYMMSPRLFLSALGQYNSSTDSLETNIRFRWEYQPGSDLFVVYTDGRDTMDPLDGPEPRRVSRSSSIAASW